MKHFPEIIEKLRRNSLDTNQTTKELESCNYNHKNLKYIFTSLNRIIRSNSIPTSNYSQSSPQNVHQTLIIKSGKQYYSFIQIQLTSNSQNCNTKLAHFRENSVKHSDLLPVCETFERCFQMQTMQSYIVLKINAHTSRYFTFI